MKPLGAPIPGQSFTAEPGKYAWQRPPQYNKPEEALRYYIEKLKNEDVLDDILFAMEMGYPIRALVESLCTLSVMKGLHTIDVSVLIGPILHEYLKSLAIAANIKYEEGLYEDQRKAVKAKDRAKARVMKAISDSRKSDAGTELVKEIVAAPEEAPVEAAATPPAEMPMEAPEETMAPTAGLMTRKV